MDLEIMILSNVSQKEKEQVSYDIAYTLTLKYDTNELIQKTEIDSQTQQADLWLPRGKEVGEGRNGSLGLADANYYIQDG